MIIYLQVKKVHLWILKCDTVASCRYSSGREQQPSFSVSHPWLCQYNTFPFERLLCWGIVMLHRNTNRAVCWKDGMYKQCENRFLFQITVVVAVLLLNRIGWRCILYFVFRKCAPVRLRLRIRTHYYIMVFGRVQILTKKVLRFRKLPWHNFWR